jgi:transposase-like protein
MLRYFPEPYEDELLYSVIARYFGHMRTTSIKSSLKALFSDENVAAVVDFPSHLNALSFSLRALKFPTPESWLTKHTLFPFWEPFLALTLRQKIRNAMLGEAGNTVHTRIGSVASWVKVQRFLKFCPACNIESHDKYGEYYWHRSHQFTLPGYCEKHGVELVNSTARFLPSAKFHFEAANKNNCVCTSSLACISSRDYELDNLLQALSNNSFEKGDVFDIRNYYWELLSQKKLIKRGSKFNIEKIVELSKKHINQFDAIYSQIDIDKFEKSIAKLNTQRAYSLHPVVHLSVLASLHDYQPFQENDIPFGVGQWPCLNPLCEHYKSPVISNFSFHSDQKSNKTIGVFHCRACGFTYTQSKDKTETQDYDLEPLLTSVVDFGALWKEKLKAVIRAGYSLRECARRLCVDPKTVADQARKLGMKIRWRTGYKKRKSYKPTQKKNRADWLSLQKQYPDCSKSFLRSLDPGLYMRLYREDKEWLARNSPSTKQQLRVNRTGVDWRIRDKQLYRELLDTKSRLIESEDYPKRITKSRLINKTRHPSWLEKKRSFFPKSSKLLESLVETNDEYITRKLRWLFANEKRHLIKLKDWQIQRKIGIRKLTPQILRLINTERYRALENYEIITTSDWRKGANRA